VNEKLAPNSLRFVEAAGGRVIRNLIQSRQAIGILPEYLCLDIRSDPHFRVTELPQQRWQEWGSADNPGTSRSLAPRHEDLKFTVSATQPRRAF